MNLLGTLFHTNRPIPENYRSNFNHLYFDVVWWGILNGSILSFLAIYAVRLGATPAQIGWLNAVPAIISLFFALPVGQWFGHRQVGRKIFWFSLLNRVFYMAFVFIPWLLTDRQQVLFIIIATLVMSIPMTFFTVGFNSLFADAVPLEWRGFVVAVRNAAVSITTVITSLICGQILERLPFPFGYQVVFFLGVLGAAASSYHLWYVRAEKEKILAAKAAPLTPGPVEITPVKPLMGRPGWQRWLGVARLDLLKTPYGGTLALLFFFHLAQYLGIPIFPLYQVNQVHFSDQAISLGVGVFNFFVFFGSTQLTRFFGRFSTKVLTGCGVVLMGTYPALMAFSRDIPSLAFASVVGGIAWSIVGGTLYNFIMERVPENDRPAHLGWYHLALNAAILLGSLSGPFIANLVGLPGAMLICGAARLLAGLAILQWG